MLTPECGRTFKKYVVSPVLRNSLAKPFKQLTIGRHGRHSSPQAAIYILGKGNEASLFQPRVLSVKVVLHYSFLIDRR